jgi:hypothetical protein
MKLNHLTFGQLAKLQSTETLVRVTRVFHTALALEWERRFSHLPGRTVFELKTLFPKIVSRYEPVLRFLVSPELRRARRLAAEKASILMIPGGAKQIRTCDYWTSKGKKEAFELAQLCKTFCQARNIPAKIQHRQGAYIVIADTDSLGAEALWAHPGVRISTLEQFCEMGDVSMRDVFWWLPANVPPQARVNPLLRCINTPDFQDYANEIIFL